MLLLESTHPNTQRAIAIARTTFDIIAPLAQQVRNTLIVSRHYRLQFEADNPCPRVTPATWAGRQILEALPLTSFGYGFGDAVTLYEAIRGRTITYEPLDPVDRACYVVASLIPCVPSGAIREPICLARRVLEDMAYLSLRHDPDIAFAMAANTASFLVRQRLPSWLR